MPNIKYKSHEKGFWTFIWNPTYKIRYIIVVSEQARKAHSSAFCIDMCKNDSPPSPLKSIKTNINVWKSSLWTRHYDYKDMFSGFGCWPGHKYSDHNLVCIEPARISTFWGGVVAETLYLYKNFKLLNHTVELILQNIYFVLCTYI